jgi:hypothetical protein
MDKQVANVDLIGINKALKIELKEEPLPTCLVVMDILPLAETVDQDQELVLVDQEPELEDQDQEELVDQVAQADQDLVVQVDLKQVDLDLEDLVEVALLKEVAPVVAVAPAVVVNPVDQAVVALVDQDLEDQESLAAVVNLVDLVQEDQVDQVVEVNQLQNNHQAVVAPMNLPVEVEVEVVIHPQLHPQLLMNDH